VNIVKAIPAARINQKCAEADAKGILGGLAFKLVPDETQAFVDAILVAKKRGARTVTISPWSERASLIVAALRLETQGLEFWCLPADTQRAEGAKEKMPGRMSDVEVFLHADGEELATELMGQLERERGLVLAPATPSNGLNRAIFLISIPKSGTHLLIELARAMGFADGRQFEFIAIPGRWHYVEFSNSHTTAPGFFIDSVRREAFGNRHHPFPSTPTLFSYRHPLDVLVSEANYYHKSGRTLFSGYLEGLDFEQRVLRLLDDPWLLGSLRDRVGQFTAWLELSNVIPVSFEELVGAKGGGSVQAQRQLIWSVLLKLQVSGVVGDIAKRVFNPVSATFRAPKIGSHREVLSAAAWEVVRSQPADYFERFGYSPDPASPLMSVRCQEFLRRPLRLQPPHNVDTPVLLEQGFFGHNVVLFKNRFFGIPCSSGPLDLSTMPDEELSQLPCSDQALILREIILDKIVSERVERLVADALRLRDDNPAG